MGGIIGSSSRMRLCKIISFVISFHFISSHFISYHFISSHFKSFHFIHQIYHNRRTRIWDVSRIGKVSIHSRHQAFNWFGRLCCEGILNLFHFIFFVFYFVSFSFHLVFISFHFISFSFISCFSFVLLLHALSLFRSHLTGKPEQLVGYTYLFFIIFLLIFIQICFPR
jgi:hypothetical protein